jgi:protein-disulfide isomerase
MDIPDTLTTRRAVLGGVGTVLTGGGVVYAAPHLGAESSEPSGPGAPGSTGANGSDGTNGSNGDSTRASQDTGFHHSTGTAGLGIDLAGHPIMGSMDAPVDIYYWTDYQCPFCKRFEHGAFPKLVENHVRTGNVRLVFIQFPYLSEGSMTAAVMDRCVWRQVRESNPSHYLRWHAAMYDAQGEKGSGWMAKENLLDLTRGVEGVDAAAVETCMDEHRSDIETSLETHRKYAAEELGIGGTPAFILYNRAAEKAGKVTGAQPYERFDEAITRVKNA